MLVLALPVGLIFFGAIARNVTRLATLVASLANRIEGTTVRGSAIPRDMAQLAAGVALHRLCLAITGEVVGATALIAGCGTATIGKAARSEARPASNGTPVDGRVGTIALAGQ